MSTLRNSRVLIDYLSLGFGLLLGPAFAWTQSEFDLMWSGLVAVNVVEWHPSKRPYLRASLQEQGDILKNRQQQNAGLTLTLFSDGLPYEGRCSMSTRYIVFAERRIDVIAMAPLQVQRVETLGQWERARIEIKPELGVELAV